MPDSDTKPDYWFPAKRYGWGWGFPIAWQGWVVMIGWIVILMAGSLPLAAHGLWVRFTVFEIVMVGVLIAVCYWKGEKPRWRWGGD